jgi:hypothetical protein
MIAVRVAENGDERRASGVAYPALAREKAFNRKGCLEEAQIAPRKFPGLYPVVFEAFLFCDLCVTLLGCS